MYISVRMSTHFFWMCFRYSHVCTNDYPIPFVCIVLIYISVRMNTISFWMDWRHLHYCTNDYHLSFIWLSSFAFLYQWLPFLFERIFVMHVSVRMTPISFSLIFVMHISVRMTTISLYMGFRHAGFYVNDFPYPLYMAFRHAHFCSNDFPYSFGFQYVQWSTTHE